MKIGILTSGGDAPGMNAVIRAVVRAGIHEKAEIIGIQRGYEGLMEGEMIPLTLSSVGDILHRVGTLLKTARSESYRKDEGQKKAIQEVKNHGLDGLVIVGGDGSFRGALPLIEAGINVMGIPGTIDNDMGYTDYTIGFDTAVNTVLEAIGRIRDTGSSHERTTIVEVMGRECGDLALYAGLTGGSDCVLIPEVPWSLEGIAEKISAGVKRGKKHSIILKAEGVSLDNGELAQYIEDKTGEEARMVVLGYLQRGGSPSARDRMLAGKMGSRAVELLLKGERNKAIGINREIITEKELKEAVHIKRQADLSLLHMIDVLSI